MNASARNAVIRAIRARGWPHAERRALRRTLGFGDLTGTPGVCWKIESSDDAKAPTDGRIAAWMVSLDQAQLNSAANIGVLVVQRRGIGVGHAHRWWAHMRLWQVIELAGHDSYRPDRRSAEQITVRMLLDDACLLLRAAGYGNPLSEPAVLSC